jgi:hypothetical protein
MGINTEAFKVLVEKSNDLEQRMKAGPLLRIPGYEATLAEYKNKVELLESARLLRAQAKEMKTIGTRSFTHSFTHSLTYSLTHSLTHSFNSNER